MENWRYANIVDRYHSINYSYQIYDTFTKRDQNGKKIPETIKRISYLDRRRFEIGLGNYKDFATAFKIDKIPEKYRNQIFRPVF